MPSTAKIKKLRKIIANPADLFNMHVKSEEEVIGKTDLDLHPAELAEGSWLTIGM
ncbi:MAG: hypothetical protein IPN18_16975 [Ignavibacteriales bacterium]|nr:hypothetical protein [Ignavibacteriales bacterium]